MDKRLWLFIYYSTALLGLIFLREFWIVSRAGLHIDESQSFILAAYNSKTLAQDVISTTGDQFRNSMWFNDKTITGMLTDLANIWHDNRDTPHSNLYYSLLRIWFTGISSSDFRFTLGWALQLNILFFCVSFTVLAALIHRLFKSHAITITGVIIAFIGAGTISNTIFARPYQLQETMFIVFLFVSFIFIENQKRGIAFLVSYGAISAVTLLTGYFSIPYVLLILFFTLIYCLVVKQVTYKELAKSCSIVVLVSLIVGYLIYPKYMFVFGYRQTEALSKTSDFLNNFRSSLLVFKFLGQNYFLPILMVIVASAICAIKLIQRQYTKRQWFILFVLVSSVIWSLAIIYFAPYKTIRYMYPAIPIFALAYCVIIFEVRRINVYCSWGLALGIIASSVYTLDNHGVIEYQYAETNKICEYSKSGNALFALDKAFRMQVFTSCLSNSKHLMTKNLKLVDGLLKENSNIEFIISDKEISGHKVIDSYSYYTIYSR